jgi:hypothetical protein
LGPVECWELAWLISIRFDILCPFDKVITFGGIERGWVEVGGD